MKIMKTDTISCKFDNIYWQYFGDLAGARPQMGVYAPCGRIQLQNWACLRLGRVG